MLHEQRVCPLLLLEQDARDLLVHQPGGLVAVLASAGHEVLAEEDLLLAVPGHGADLLAHTPLVHHPPGDAGGLLEVVGGAGVEVTEDDLLGDATAHRLADDVLEELLRVRVPLLGRLHVTPSAMPRGRMVTLCSGSALGSTTVRIAWPPSW